MERVLFMLFIRFMIVFPKTSADSLQNKYLGCFRNFSNQISTPKPSVVDQSMTIEFCIDICRNSNSTFAGLQGGDQCLCGDDFNKLVNESNCKQECSGNSFEYCGGRNECGISVYSVCGIGYWGFKCDRVCHCDRQAPCQRLTGRCPTGCDENYAGQTCDTADATTTKTKWYIGCYGDNNTRAMESWNPRDNTGDLKSNNSINHCINVCASLNYTYIGAQYHDHCFCGESYAKYGPKYRCNSTCSANRSQICGGSYANSVYSVCPSGSFSVNCLSRCNCINDSRCIYRNGTCPDGCKPGWKGDSCNIRACGVANGSCDGPNEFCEEIELKYAKTIRCGCKKGFTRNKPWDNCTESSDVESACESDARTVSANLSFVGTLSSILQVTVTKLEQHSHSTDNSKSGIIAGAILGCFFVLAIFGAIGIFLYRRNVKDKKTAVDKEFVLRFQSDHKNGVEDANIIQKQSGISANSCNDECTYYNSVQKPTGIKVDSLAKHFNETRTLEKEFKSVPLNATLSNSIGKRKELKKKNRFKNILPYDHNRVILSKLNDQIYSDYINASYIMGYKTSDKFIATQGPTPETIDDFWRMIVEKRVSVIAMITGVYENGKKKCEKYWPDVGEILTFGDVTVSITSEQKWHHFEQRCILAKGNSVTLQLTHWHYTSWPDHDVPQNVRSFLTFRRKVRNSMSSDSFTMVHCSAGAGRTGSYLAVDYLLEEAKTGFVDVLNCLRNLRLQRPQMIQTLEQYRFVYAALVDQLSTGETVLTCNDYEQQFNDLRTKDSISGKTKLDLHFEMLSRQNEGNTSNKTKDNRNSETSVVQGIRTNVCYIVKTVSLSVKPDNVWNSYVDHKANLIVFVSENENSLSFVPTKTRPITFGNFNLLLDSTKKETWVSTYNMKLFRQTDAVYANVTDVSDGENVTLLYVHVEPSPNRDCVDHQSISEAFAIMKRHSKTLDHSTIIIMSESDERLSGFCAAAFSAFDMITEENEVDVYQIVHDMRMSNSRFIPTLTAYEELHEVVRQYLKSRSAV